MLLLSGAGFDVVPSDCLVARLHERLPGADRLTIAFPGLEGTSPGTLRTAARLLGEGVAVREGGELRTVPYGSRTIEVDTGVGDGPRRTGVVPFGDVVTAYHTTDIPNVEVYAEAVMGLPPGGQQVLSTLRPVLAVEAVQGALMALADRFVEGPDARERAAGSVYFWARASGGERSVSGRVHTPESYQFTAEAVVDITGRILDGEAPPGFQTPADVYGSDLVLAVEGARFEAVGESPAD